MRTTDTFTLSRQLKFRNCFLFFPLFVFEKRLSKFFVIRRRCRALRPVLTFRLATSTTWTTGTSTITTTIRPPKTPPRQCSFRTRCGAAWWSRTCPRTCRHLLRDRCVMLITISNHVVYSGGVAFFCSTCIYYNSIRYCIFIRAARFCLVAYIL